MDLQELRDLVIVIFGIAAIVTLFVALVMTLVLGLAARALVATVQNLLRGEVTPLLESVRQATDNVRGTTTFIADTTVAPIIRAYSVLAGTRRVVGVLMGLAGRRRS